MTLDMHGKGIRFGLQNRIRSATSSSELLHAATPPAPTADSKLDLGPKLTQSSVILQQAVQCNRSRPGRSQQGDLTVGKPQMDKFPFKAHKKQINNKTNPKQPKKKK